MSIIPFTSSEILTFSEFPLVKFQASIIETINVFNFAGQSVLNEGISNYSYRLNISEWDPGLYLFHITTNKGTTIKRIVVK